MPTGLILRRIVAQGYARESTSICPSLQGHSLALALASRLAKVHVLAVASDLQWLDLCTVLAPFPYATTQ